MPPAKVLEGRDLEKLYRMGEVDVHALRGVDLALYEGEFVVLLGPSGSGKSTLLNILGGLDVPTRGSVLYRGRDLTAADDDELTEFRRDHVGFVFQFYNLIPSLTARENVALVTEIAPNPLVAGRRARARGPRAPHRSLPVAALGRRAAARRDRARDRQAARRAAVRRADRRARRRTPARVVLQVLEQVNRELGTTTAIITHNAPIASMADRVVTLADGRVEEHDAQRRASRARRS